MTVALVIVVPVYLIVASVIALNSALEAERLVLTAADLAMIGLVSSAWPVVSCALLSGLAYRALVSKKRQFLPAMR